MASPYLLNAGPGQDKFSNLYSKYDNAVDEIINGASLVGNNLVLSKYNGTDFIVNLAALAGGGSTYVYHEVAFVNSPYQLPEDYHAVVGAYTQTGVVTIDLPVNPLEEPRLISIRDLGGNASVNNIVIRRNSVPVFIINVNGEGVTIAYDHIQGAYLLISNYNASGGVGLPSGTVDGQNIRWDNAGQDWVLATSLITLIDPLLPELNLTRLTTADGRPTSECGFMQIHGGDIQLSTQPCNATTYARMGMVAMQTVVENVSPAGAIRLKLDQPTGNIELTTQVVGGGVVVDAPEALEIKDNTPAAPTGKLYNSGGNLFWSGSQICIAPCGGGGPPYTIARSSVLNPGTFNVPVPGTEAERIVTIDAAVGPGSFTIVLPTTGVNTNYRITVKRVNVSPLTHNIVVSAGTGTIDTLSGPVGMNFSAFESISFIARPGTPFGTYDWVRDDNYIDPAALPSPYSVQNIKYTTAGPHTIVPNPGVNKIIVRVEAGVPVEINLPASPSNNLEVVVKAALLQDAWINWVQVKGNGNTIDSLLLPALINFNRGSLTFIWNSDGANSTWMII